LYQVIEKPLKELNDPPSFKEKSIKIYFEDNEDLDELLTLLGGGQPITL
jgi:hypothetical protein